LFKVTFQKCLQTGCQNYTDFTKALFVLSESEKNPDSVEFPDKLDAILAYVECSAASGRPDQVRIEMFILDKGRYTLDIFARDIAIKISSVYKP